MLPITFFDKNFGLLMLLNKQLLTSLQKLFYYDDELFSVRNLEAGFVVCGRECLRGQVGSGDSLISRLPPQSPSPHCVQKKGCRATGSKSDFDV